jgi:agmatinase
LTTFCTGDLNCLRAGEKCYISIDIDVLDMALVGRMEVVGIDLVEVNPQLDAATGVTSYLAAHVLVELLGHLLAIRLPG